MSYIIFSKNETTGIDKTVSMLIKTSGPEGVTQW
jgi:hypothetical protein